MANKVGILTGFLLIILNVLAEIPIGLYFTMEFSSFTSIPLFFATNGSIVLYAWGTSESGWWFNLGITGISGLIVQSILIISCILSFIGSWIIGNKGKKILGAIIIMEFICLIFLMVDLLFIGSLGFSIAFISIFQSIGGGFYLLLIICILQFIAFKTHLKKV